MTDAAHDAAGPRFLNRSLTARKDEQPTHDVAAIARSLTKAQREAVLGKRSLGSGAGMWALRNALIRKGLAQGVDCHWTPLGLAVRQHLVEEEGL